MKRPSFWNESRLGHEYTMYCGICKCKPSSAITVVSTCCPNHSGLWSTPFASTPLYSWLKFITKIFIFIILQLNHECDVLPGFTSNTSFAKSGCTLQYYITACAKKMYRRCSVFLICVVGQQNYPLRTNWIISHKSLGRCMASRLLQ